MMTTRGDYLGKMRSPASEADFVPNVDLCRVYSPKLHSGIHDLRTRRLDLILNIHQAVILGDPLPAARTSRFQVARPQPHGQIGNEVIGRLAGSVRDEDAPAQFVCHFCPKKFCSVSRVQDAFVNQRITVIQTYADSASVMVPIWLIFSKRELHAVFSLASPMRSTLVARRSSPTSSTGHVLLNAVQDGQSSCAYGSSSRMIGYLSSSWRYRSPSFSPVYFSDVLPLKPRSYSPPR